MTAVAEKNDVLSERAAARQALADAIASVDTAVARLDEAKCAASAGLDRAIDIGNKVLALEIKLPQLPNTPPAGAVVAALSSGGDVMELERSPRARVEAEIADLKATRDQLRCARDLAEREVEARKRAVEDARLRAHRAAVEVVKVSGAAEQLLRGLADLQEQVVKRRVALRFLAAFGAIPEDEVGAVEALLSADRELPGLSAQGGSVDWRRHPAHGEWWQALATLERDPDAPLPA